MQHKNKCVRAFVSHIRDVFWPISPYLIGFFISKIIPVEWFIQLHRQILEWEWYDDPKTFSVFLHCLLKANWKDKNWRWKLIERWSFITSLESLANETKLSVRSVRTCLKKLEMTNELTKKSTSSYTLIVINKYDDYQWSDKQDDKRKTNERQTSDNNE